MGSTRRRKRTRWHHRPCASRVDGRVYVELPKVGADVEARSPIAVVESVKAASDIYAPVKGTVVEVNKALESNPALINTDPFGEGWIFLLKMASPDDLKELKDPAAYRTAIG